MKILINITEIKMDKDLLIVNTDNDRKIIVDNFSKSEKLIYDKFIKLSSDADQFYIENSEIDLIIHRVCPEPAKEDKYINYNELTSSDKKVVDDFIELVKNNKQ